MKITELHAQHFGKFRQKHVQFHDGINLIMGENESGKSTLHTLIRSMLFGMQRMRGRASRKDDYSRYSPWEEPTFYAGGIRLEKGGKQYRLMRNFYRRENSAELFCETDGKKLSVEQGDLDRLLGGVRQGVYENTLCIGQLKAAPSESIAGELQKHFNNELHTLDETVDMEKALKQLAAERRELLGRQKELLRQKEELRNMHRVQMEYVREEAGECQSTLEEVSLELSQKKEEAQAFQSSKARWELEEQQMLRQEKQQLEQQKQQARQEREAVAGRRPEKREMSPREKIAAARKSALEMVVLSLVIAAVLLVTSHTLLQDDLMTKWLYFLAAAAVVLSVVGAIRLVRISAREQKGVEAESVSLPQIPEETPEREEAETLQKISALEQQQEQERRGRWEEMQEKERQLQQELYRLEWKQSDLQEELQEKQRLMENRQEDLDEVAAASETEKYLEQEIAAAQLAIDTIKEISEEIKGKLGEELQRRMSEILAKITGGAYQSVELDEDEKPELYNGRRVVPLFRVSQGTAEQAYFALRLAAADLLMGEDQLPIMLDDTFAMYDDERLARTLRYLADRGQQILLFTCTRREQQLLNLMEIPYHQISL